MKYFQPVANPLITFIVVATILLAKQIWAVHAELTAAIVFVILVPDPLVCMICCLNFPCKPVMLKGNHASESLFVMSFANVDAQTSALFMQCFNAFEVPENMHTPSVCCFASEGFCMALGWRRRGQGLHSHVPMVISDLALNILLLSHGAVGQAPNPVE